MLQNGQKSWGGGSFKEVFVHTYEDIISTENLLDAWKEFRRGKRGKKDVQEFQADLMHNVLHLYGELKAKTYKHGGYLHFRVSDPKPRDIHKASVRDRLVHHALYRKLYPFFDATFISHSYSCRKCKGTHRAMKAFKSGIDKGGRNNTKTLWVLKCDIRKFFASVDQEILIKILRRQIPDENVVRLVGNVAKSFHSTAPGKGLPLGNLTSQLLVNVYMNEFDRFVKHKVKAKYYIRYADDFVILSRDKDWLEKILPNVRVFLRDELCLTLHPSKVSIGTIASGIDFLGWVHFPGHRVLRTTTKRRMLRRAEGLEKGSPTVQSYLGMLSHGNAKKLQRKIIFYKSRSFKSLGGVLPMCL
jgi:RNA-directed DNA polymerase